MQPPKLKCSVCKHGSRAEIEAALLYGRSRASIAKQYAAGRMSVNRHAANCMSLPEVNAKLKRTIAKERKRADDTVAAVVAGVVAPLVRTPEAVQEYNERLLHALDRQRIVAEGVADVRTALAIAREEISLLANVARNLGITREGTTINVDASTRKLEIAVGKLSLAEIDAALASITGGGAIEIPAAALEAIDVG